MLLSHPKYKGSFIVLPALSFHSKLINSETWMKLEFRAPLKPPPGFSERFPSPYTSWALLQWGGQRYRALPCFIKLLPCSTNCCLLCIQPYSPAPRAFGSPHFPTSSVCLAACALPSPACYLQRHQGSIRSWARSCPVLPAWACLDAASKDWAALELVMLICVALPECTLLA